MRQFKTIGSKRFLPDDRESAPPVPLAQRPGVLRSPDDPARP